MPPVKALMNPETIHDILSGSRKGPVAGLLRCGLAAASVPYAAAVRVRRWAYRRQFPLFVSRRPKAGRVVPTICVGNLTTGGTGKTPMVAWIVEYLKTLGRRPAILTRGYKARQGQSDEARVLADLCGPEVAIIANADRLAAAQAAVNAGADMLVMDDGFQHRRLARDLDVVLIDATNPFGYGHCLPRGLMREPASALREAHVLILTRCDHTEPLPLADLHARLATLAPQASVLQSAHVPDCVLDEAALRQPPATLRGRRVFAFCGLGNPRSFFEMARRLGAEIVGTRTFADHFAYGPADVEAMVEAARMASAEALLTTRKDFVKIADNPSDLPLWQLSVRVEITRGRERLCERVEKVLG